MDLFDKLQNTFEEVKINFNKYIIFAGNSNDSSIYEVNVKKNKDYEKK